MTKKKTLWVPPCRDPKVMEETKLQKQGHPCIHNRINLCALDNIRFDDFKKDTGTSKCDGCIQYEPKIIIKKLCPKCRPTKYGIELIGMDKCPICGSDGI